MFKINIKNSWNSKINFVFKGILHYACQSGNLHLVEYLLSLDVFEIDAETIFTEYFFYEVPPFFPLFRF